MINAPTYKRKGIKMAKTSEYSITVTKVPTRMVVRDAPPSSVRAGERFLFTGTLEAETSPGVWSPLEGKTVWLCWPQRIASDVTDSYGNWDFVVTISDPGTYRVFVEFPGDDAYLGCSKSEDKLSKRLLRLLLEAAVPCWRRSWQERRYIR